VRIAGSEFRDPFRKAAVATLLAVAAFGCSGQGDAEGPFRLTGDQESGWVVTFVGGGRAGELQVFTGGGDESAAGRLPVLGDVSDRREGPSWAPRYPLRPGQQYTAVWQPSSGERISTTFTVPRLDLPATTTVAAVYPSTEVVPENLLRLYIQFSAPMSRGGASQFVALVDGNDGPITDAFVVPQQELWSSAEDRLTLFFDPGRLKQEVGPNLAAGTPLRAGQEVTLRVQAEWRDAHGTPLRESFEHTWKVVEADRERPRTDAWTVHAPATPAGRLRLEFPEALDRALLHRMLAVESQAGAPIAGEITVASGEREWTFLPSSPWSSGSYTIRVDPDLEDLAGNSLERLFDEPLVEDQVGRPALGPVRLAFTVGPE